MVISLSHRILPDLIYLNYDIPYYTIIAALLSAPVKQIKFCIFPCSSALDFGSLYFLQKFKFEDIKIFVIHNLLMSFLVTMYSTTLILQALFRTVLYIYCNNDLTIATRACAKASVFPILKSTSINLR